MARPARTYCTMPGQHGEHDAACMPPAEPGNPELRLLRALCGLCPDCNDADPHAHHPDVTGADPDAFYGGS